MHANKWKYHVSLLRKVSHVALGAIFAHEIAAGTIIEARDVCLTFERQANKPVRFKSFVFFSLFTLT